MAIPGVPGVVSVVPYVDVRDAAQSAAAFASPEPPHRGLPTPTLTVIVTADETLLCSETLADWRARRGARHQVCLGALHTQPVYLQRPRRQEGVQIAVHPLAARRLFGLPAAALTELTQEGDAVLGPSIAALRSRVTSTPDPAERARLVAAELGRRARAGSTASGPRREVVGAWTLIERSGGQVAVADVAQRVGLTPRHLGSLLRAELGIGTKQLVDLVRFSAAHARLTAALRAGLRPDLTDLAADHGFADHSHLVRVYRRFAQATPTQWIAEEFRNVQAAALSGGAVSEP